MKKTYFGAGLLVVLFVLSLLCAWFIRWRSQPLCRSLEQAQSLYLAGEEAAATQKLDAAYRDWQNQKDGIAALVDHAPMEQIEDLFRSAQEYAALWDREQAALLCGRICRLMEATVAAQQGYWWNLL